MNESTHEGCPRKAVRSNAFLPMSTHVHFLAGSWQMGVNRRLRVSSDVTLDARKPLKTQCLVRFGDSGMELRFPVPCASQEPYPR